MQRRTKEFLFEFGPIIGFQLQQEIRAEQFPWPTVRGDGRPLITYRKNGEEVTTPRNIVDTGTLVKSQTRPKILLQGEEVQLQIQWTAPYSKQVLEGGYLIGTMRNAYLAPQRDWISPAIQKTDPLAYMQRRFSMLSRI